MKQTRREFMKDAAIAGAAAVTAGAGAALAADTPQETASGAKCPYFDQPLMCKGTDSSGRYRCDS